MTESPDRTTTTPRQASAQAQTLLLTPVVCACPNTKANPPWVTPHLTDTRYCTAARPVRTTTTASTPVDVSDVDPQEARFHVTMLTIGSTIARVPVRSVTWTAHCWRE